jgi:hypothetical protein
MNGRPIRSGRGHPVVPDAITPTIDAPDAGYCLGCGYRLTGLTQPRCPECGRRFDPARRRSYASSPHAWRVRRWGARVALSAACLAALVGAALGWLYGGWKSEQNVISSLPTRYLVAEPIGRPAFRSLVPKRLERLLDRTRWIELGGVMEDGSCPEVTDDHLAALSKLSRLRTVSVSDGFLPGTRASPVTDKGLKHLGSLPRLEQLGLRVDMPKVTDQGFADLSRLVRLRKLSISEVRGVTDAGFAHLARLRGLSYLRVGVAPRVTDEGVAHLAALPGLEKLILRRTRATDACLKDLGTIKTLRDLEFNSPSVTGAGLGRLRAERPDLNVARLRPKFPN